MKLLIRILVSGAPLALLLAVAHLYRKEHAQRGRLLEASAGYRAEAARSSERASDSEERLVRLQAAFVAQSNSAAQAQAELLAEKATHDPLRAQIEKMSGVQLTFQSQLRRMDEQLARTQADLRSARELLQAAREDYRALEQKAKQLEEAVAPLTLARDEWKRKADQAAEFSAKLESDLTTERINGKDLEAKLATASNRAATAFQQQTNAKSSFDKALQKTQADLAAARARIAELEAAARKPAP